MTTAWRRSVLMGDPAFFRIKAGANPHTRTRWGFRKTVDRRRAVEQWHRLARTLGDLGVDVYVLPAVEPCPGMVFPANAGFLSRTHEPSPIGGKPFHLSKLLPGRAEETRVYAQFLRAMGFEVKESTIRFEGEADFFPAGGVYLFTSGPIRTQRFVYSPGWPPYRRVYGFRSAPAALDELSALHPSDTILPLSLARETHYHGDTCLCAFGPAREFLLAYLPALSAASAARLRERFGEKLLPLSDEDGELFSANSFQVDGPEPVLVMPHTATAALQARVRERGVRPIPVDVSEFLSKGGGAVKCMVGDLGPLRADASDAPGGAATFRKDNLYGVLFPSGR
jgi:N-dimethylarginine dimethylaminohydrolase